MKNNFPQTNYGAVSKTSDIPLYPVIVKRRSHGYDGKGQARVDSAKDLELKKDILNAPCVWEKIVPFVKEISVILARNQNGETIVYPVAENVHRNGILHKTRAPAQIENTVAALAVELAQNIAQALDHVGVMAVEMFLLDDGRLLVNEIAPRVHNSGHYTLGACKTSQFEQHVRAVCGLPFGPVDMPQPAVMVNLLGDVWKNGIPQWKKITSIPGLELHLYGKSSARPGRKMGHYTVVGAEAANEWELSDNRLRQISDLS